MNLSSTKSSRMSMLKKCRDAVPLDKKISYPSYFFIVVRNIFNQQYPNYELLSIEKKKKLNYNSYYFLYTYRQTVANLEPKEFTKSFHDNDLCSTKKRL